MASAIPDPPSCEQLADAASFWAVGDELLLADESIHNLMIGLVLGMASGERLYDEARFVAVRWGGRLVGLAMQTDTEHPLILSLMPVEAAHAVADHFLERGDPPTQFTGEVTVSAAYAARARQAGHAPTVRMRQGVYELGCLEMPSPEGGHLVCAGAAEEDRVQHLLEGFIGEALGEPKAGARTILERLLPAGHVYLWRDASGELVSMAARNRATPTTATLSMVYTPPEHRRRGYAARVVAGLSKVWLDHGKRTCNLYTDLANDTSNSVYRRLGYVQLAESHVYECRIAAR